MNQLCTGGAGGATGRAPGMSTHLALHEAQTAFRLDELAHHEARLPLAGVAGEEAELVLPAQRGGGPAASRGPHLFLTAAPGTNSPSTELILWPATNLRHTSEPLLPSPRTLPRLPPYEHGLSRNKDSTPFQLHHHPPHHLTAHGKPGFLLRELCPVSVVV